ncbi:unnamed protein product [Prorocentrum cordatum]|uniref:C3H1-type domain-containing protein n=1 Tax=Prorocentrum cordatum TaxID=2364126 RepID=A0ABN9RII5_9DINO|nr:unnamed protein product [Polarella glacialis]
MPLGGAAPPALAEALASPDAPPNAASSAEATVAAPQGAGSRRTAEGEADDPVGRPAPTAQREGSTAQLRERPRAPLREPRRRGRQLAEALARLAAGPPGLQRQADAALAATGPSREQWLEAWASVGQERLDAAVAACVGGPASPAVRLEEESRRQATRPSTSIEVVHFHLLEALVEALREPQGTAESLGLKQDCLGAPLLGTGSYAKDAATGMGFDAIGIKPVDPTVVRERPERFCAEASTVEASREETRLKDTEKNEKEQTIEGDLAVIKSILEDLILEKSLEEYGLPTNDLLDDLGQAGATIVQEARSSLARAMATLHRPTPVAGASPTDLMTSHAVAETSSDAGPTWGSTLHSEDRCRPCLFVKRGCRNSNSCPFCHICTPAEKRRVSENKVKHFSWRCLRKATAAARARARG